MSLVPDARLSALLLRAEIDDFNTDYADKLDRQDLTAWTDCFSEDAFYTVISRENFERRYPVGLIYCEGRAMIVDRAFALLKTAMFGFEGDSEEMTRHRLRQGNLMGPAGFLGLEDNEAIKFVQDGMLRVPGGEHLVKLDPTTPFGTSETLISESAIRAMYRHWREAMAL